MPQGVEKATDEDAHYVQCEGHQEEEEVAIIPASNAVIDPWTVVIKLLHTVVTNTTVRAARRPIKAAGGTPLHANLDSSHFHCLI